MSDDSRTYDFDIAVSFAGEDRRYVNDVVNGVKATMRVFYDEDYLVETWGSDLVEYFSTLYMNRTKYVVMFISTHYANKEWARIERRAALARAMMERSAYVLPIRLDDTALPGLLPTIGYIDARRYGLEKIIEAIREKVSVNRTTDEAATKTPLIAQERIDVERLITERPELWEYRLFAGLLLINRERLESEYRDYMMKFARPNADTPIVADVADYSRAALSRLSVIAQNLEVVLDKGVQVQAFGAPGEPGDPDRISHLAQRFATVYEDLMTWSYNLRAATTAHPDDVKVLRALAEYTVQPVDACRQFITDYKQQIIRTPELLRNGELIEITMEVVFEISDEVRQAYDEALQSAVSRPLA